MKENSSSDLLSFSCSELEKWMEDRGESAFHGRQVFHWFHKRAVHDYQQMTDLSKKLRERLAEEAPLRKLTIKQKFISPDGTIKYRIALCDEREIECVYIPFEDRRTLCVSVQVGCAMGCAFCATARMGLVRNLSAGEITGQLELVLNDLAGQHERPVTNVVFMGMGEPLANFSAMARAVENFRAPLGYGLSRRHITVSTCGLVPAMEKFATEVPARLAVSLNASTDEVRSQLMPVNRRWNLEKLINCCRRLDLAGVDRITFEYVMIRGINDTPEDARRLAKLLSGLLCKINLIPYNPVTDIPFQRPEESTLLAFQRILLDKNFSVFIRQSRGEQIAAACGQLVAQSGKK